MLGYESERRLKDVLMGVSEGESELENARQRLCTIRDFAPHAAFQRVDRNMSDFVNSFELLNFLRENGVHHITEGELYQLVRFFDSDEDGRLSFQDFIQMLLPCEDNYLRNITLDRPSHRVGRYDHLPRDIEVALACVIEKEVDMQRRTDILKRDLVVRFDYTPLAAFRSIDRYAVGRIDTINLGTFLRNNNSSPSEAQLLAIIRRVDTDGDAALCFNEFAEYM